MGYNIEFQRGVRGEYCRRSIEHQVVLPESFSS